MTKIPEHQQIGPAGHHKAIAFRPACLQLQAQLNPDGMAEYFITMPTGEKYILATIEPTPTALVWLDAAGICKTGGDIVPILSPTAAASVQSGRLTLTPSYIPQSTGFPVVLWLLVAVISLVLGAIALRPQSIPSIQGFLGGGDDEN